MAVPAMLMAGGTLLQIIGNYSSNLSRASAEMENSRFYFEQARYYEEATQRAMNIASRKYTMTVGQQLSSGARGGLDVGAGDMVSIVAGTLADKYAELHAIRRKGDMDIQLARMRGQQAESTAGMLSNPVNNIFQSFTTFLGNYAGTQGFGTNFSALKDMFGESAFTSEASTMPGKHPKYLSGTPSSAPETNRGSSWFEPSSFMGVSFGGSK